MADDVKLVLNMIEGVQHTDRIVVLDEGDDRSATIVAVVKALNRFGEVYSFADATVVVAETESAILREGIDSNAPFVRRKRPIRADTVNLIRPMERAIKWHGRVQRGQRIEIVRKRMDPWIIKAIANLGPTGGLRELAGVVDHPVWWDGQLLTGSIGYHPPTKLYIDSKNVHIDPDMYTSPQDAFNFLAEEWMMEARFDSFQDLVHFLSMPLTLIKRPTSIRRGCPIYLLNAPEPNSGKTTSAEAAHLLVTGGLPGVTEYPEDRNEFQKSYAAALIETPTMILFDNLPNGWHWRNATLDKAATSDTMRLRILGKTQEVEVSTLPVVCVTGNALQPGSADSMSRALWVNFRGPKPGRLFNRDLIGFTAENRSELLSAYAKIAQAEISSAARIPGGRFSDWENEVAAPMMIASRTGIEIYDLWAENRFLTSVDEAAADLVEAMVAEQEEIAKSVADLGLLRLAAGKDQDADARVRINNEGFMPGDMAVRFQDQLYNFAVARGKKHQSDESKISARAVNELLAPLDRRRFGTHQFKVTLGKKPNGRKKVTFRAEVAES